MHNSNYIKVIIIVTIVGEAGIMGRFGCNGSSMRLINQKLCSYSSQTHCFANVLGGGEWKCVLIDCMDTKVGIH